MTPPAKVGKKQNTHELSAPYVVFAETASPFRKSWQIVYREKYVQMLKEMWCYIIKRNFKLNEAWGRARCRLLVNIKHSIQIPFWPQPPLLKVCTQLQCRSNTLPKGRIVKDDSNLWSLSPLCNYTITHCR